MKRKDSGRTSSFLVNDKKTFNDVCYSSMIFDRHLPIAIIIEKEKIEEYSIDDLKLFFNSLTPFCQIKFDDLVEETLTKRFKDKTTQVDCYILQIPKHIAEDLILLKMVSTVTRFLWQNTMSEPYIDIAKHYINLLKLFPEEDSLKLLCYAHNIALVGTKLLCVNHCLAAHCRIISSSTYNSVRKDHTLLNRLFDKYKDYTLSYSLEERETWTLKNVEEYKQAINELNSQ